MKLHYKVSGSGTPLVIAHGLFGTLENWGGQIKALSEHFLVYAVDLRNHGLSPWSSEMDYPSMSTDLLEFLDDHQLDQVLLLGHSMGGKAAMQLALDHPRRIRKLVVVDIAPVQYPHHHDQVFEGLFNVDLQKISSRKEADSALAEYVEEVSVRQFLLKNLYRDKSHFAWRMNLDSLQKEYEQLAKAPQSKGKYQGQTLFIKGGVSNYIQESHRSTIAHLFPNASARILDGVGHWPHAEKPAVFTKILLRFLQQP
ncbi:alpha/beta fold hydrolase [Motiliproteus sp. MSK22-1]|uniref:alpha/beta fold hydrolase n=1 Tax=Motiliproteus sp. MSK22-1 TaxID=1897630 RepID=UPI0009760176|nr:alpha/beta fold hydrolase [Motiliproteus sp. MSK22-1]OMH33962.1 acyl-CoA esterase [Motiliproteus sp. MSK22-1]